MHMPPATFTGDEAAACAECLDVAFRGHQDTFGALISVFRAAAPPARAALVPKFRALSAQMRALLVSLYALTAAYPHPMMEEYGPRDPALARFDAEVASAFAS